MNEPWTSLPIFHIFHSQLLKTGLRGWSQGAWAGTVNNPPELRSQLCRYSMLRSHICIRGRIFRECCSREPKIKHWKVSGCSQINLKSDQVSANRTMASWRMMLSDWLSEATQSYKRFLWHGSNFLNIQKIFHLIYSSIDTCRVFQFSSAASIFHDTSSNLQIQPDATMQSSINFPICKYQGKGCQASLQCPHQEMHAHQSSSSIWTFSSYHHTHYPIFHNPQRRL